MLILEVTFQIFVDPTYDNSMMWQTLFVSLVFFSIPHEKSGAVRIQRTAIVRWIFFWYAVFELTKLHVSMSSIHLGQVSAGLCHTTNMV